MTRRLVVCLDGTWNSTYAGSRRDDGHMVLKPSNTLKVARAVVPRAKDGALQLTYYDIGVGSLGDYPGFPSRLLTRTDKILGGVWGAGFEGNVEDALHFLTLNHEPDDEVFLFGFSRGAATARAVTRFLDWSGGLPPKIDAYYLPVLFRRYVLERGEPSACAAALGEINARRRNRSQPDIGPFVPVRVKYLGIWDTVMALGSRFRASDQKKLSFHAGSAPARCVETARHALAIDETRYDFRPEVWSGNDPATHRQRWFVGVHSNVGGGYDRDGLANIAFRWVLAGAVDAGLEVDGNYVKFFRPFPLHSLYQSASLGFRIMDAIRLRTGRGKRALIAYPNVELDPSVVKRMQAPLAQIAENPDPNAIKELYRPENVLELLASKPDLPGYLRELGIEKPLPEDVEQRIAALRRRHTQSTPLATLRP